MTSARLSEPAIVVLAGAAGSGKSTWAAERFRTAEIVSSDALRAAVGSGPSDLDASVEAFALLDQIVSARIRRSLTTVIDTLGLDRERRADYLRLARAGRTSCSARDHEHSGRGVPGTEQGARPTGSGASPHRSDAQDQKTARRCS